MALTPGTRLGPYEVLSALGAGGMGEGYKARDTRLARTVAVKVLRADTATDAAARARFEREARAIATLSHPHICVIHDVGHQDGIDYLVMELLEGETLAERLARAKGPLPLDQVLTIGIAIADALDRAHRAGIVHRDLKPLNVMLTKSGPKLLDFGLAKLHGAASPGSLSTASAATTAGPATAKGTILGTIHYLAPEQVEGREADARSDIWALGALLYEMSTGQRPFDGESAASIVGAILKDTPPALSARQPLTPPAFERLVTKCLAKDADDRWQSARDLRGELTWIADSGAFLTPAPVPARPRTSNRLAWTIAALASVVAVGAIVVSTRERNGPAPITSWLSIPPPAGRFADRIEVSVSPDGRQVAFFAPDTDGVLRLFIRALDSPTARVLAGTEGHNPGDGGAAWAPDGKALALFARGKLVRVEAAGGAPQILADAPGSSRGVTWGTQATILFVPSSGAGVYQVPAAGGATAQRLALGPAGDAAEYPSFLPDGRHFLFDTQTGLAPTVTPGAYLATTGAQDVVLVTTVRSAVAYASGHLFFGQRGTLFAQPFDLTRLATTGEPFRVADGLGSSGGTGPHFAYSVSEHGTLVFANSTFSPVSQLTWYDRQGRLLAAVGEPGMEMGLALSPDGTRAAIDRADAEGGIDLWLVDLSTGTPALFSRTAQLPQWNRAVPGRLLFRRGNAIFSGAAASDRSDSVSAKGLPARPWLMDVSPDGHALLVRVDHPKTLADLWVVTLGEAGETAPYLTTSASEFAGRFSPDGRWVAYSSDESGRSEIYVQAYPAGGAKLRVSRAGGVWPEWSPNGREVYFVAPDNRLMAATVTDLGSTLATGSAAALFNAPPLAGSNLLSQYRREYAAWDNGQRFLFNAVVPEKTPPTITVVQNWTPPRP